MKAFFQAILKWLDGNKTILGTLILVMVEGGIFGTEGTLYSIMVWLGGLLAGIGVVHKGIKGTSNTGK